MQSPEGTIPSRDCFFYVFFCNFALMNNGFLRIAAGSPVVTVADTATNALNIKQLMQQAHSQSAEVLVLPEMCVTAYTCADLFHNRALLAGVEKAMDDIISESIGLKGLLTFVGLPVLVDNQLYNCAAAIAEGKLLAVVPKTYIPNYNEFYEKRWFRSGAEANATTARICNQDVPFGTDIVIEHQGVTIGAEICEDLWTPMPPSCRLSLAGAEVIVNLSASDDLIGKYHYLSDLVRQQSARCISAYAYASAGFGESSTDLVFDAKLFVCENGRTLAVNERWQDGNQMIVTDVDIEAIRRDRMHNCSFGDCEADNRFEIRKIYSSASSRQDGTRRLLRQVDSLPFVPADKDRRKARCEEIINIQAAGLAKRLHATNCKCLVIGISGGLDSTLALLVAARSFDRLGLDRKGIVGVTMPGFGTTGRTHDNAVALMTALGVTQREISIVKAVNQHFEDIGHDPSVTDVTYENSQARERTQILMDIANQAGGMVLGTGDLSELALGWATYNGDHMSMYGVNTGVPKTLVRYLAAYFAEISTNEDERRALLDIIDTPISPELIPAAADGTIKQKTEDLVGPYELHDFFLYYTLRYGFRPSRIYMLAKEAFAGTYDDATILKWEKTFFRRFFNQQFKRSCLPDGPKVGSVCLSPRGDWRMPSDASSALWLKELDEL